MYCERATVRLVTGAVGGQIRVGEAVGHLLSRAGGRIRPTHCSTADRARRPVVSSYTA